MNGMRNEQEHAAWLADKIVAGGDYAKEAAQMLRRWPAQPPQDERGQRLSAWQISERMPTRHRQRTSLENINDVLEVISAEPAQPVALSTLTDSEIVKQVKNSFDSYDHAEINRRELVQSIRAALIASAPAQQTEPVQPECSAEVKALKRMAEAGWTDPDISVASLQKALKEALALAESEGSRAVAYLRRARKAEAAPPQPVAAEVERDAARYRFLRMDAGIRNGRPFIAISSAGGMSQWTGIHADKQVDAAMAGTGSDESKKGDV